MLWQDKDERTSDRKVRNRGFPPLSAFGTRLVKKEAQRRRAQRNFREEEMIDMSKLGQTLVSTVAAAMLTVTAVGAAVGPARALETEPVSLVAAPVSGQASA
jgi:hypothetical protein